MYQGRGEGGGGGGVTEDGKVLNRKINTMKGFLEGDSYSLVGSCLTEVPVSLLMEETDGYAMRQRDEKRVKRRHNLFAENSKHLS